MFCKKAIKLRKKWKENPKVKKKPIFFVVFFFISSSSITPFEKSLFSSFAIERKVVHFYWFLEFQKLSTFRFSFTTTVFRFHFLITIYHSRKSFCLKSGVELQLPRPPLHLLYYYTTPVAWLAADRNTPGYQFSLIQHSSLTFVAKTYSRILCKTSSKKRMWNLMGVSSPPF